MSYNYIITNGNKFFLWVISRWSCCTVTHKLSQGVVAFLGQFISITKPELYYWKFCLVGEETAVFTPYIIILITVTGAFRVCTRVVHPACALTTARWCSTPVRHLIGITWHPPSISAIPEHLRFITAILYKLLTVCGDSGEIGQLRQTRSIVINDTWLATRVFKSFHMSPVLTVVTDDSHANSIRVSHVTVHWEWCQISFATWINVVVSTFCCRVSVL